MSFSAYPSYRDSGAPSLGLLPEHWTMAPIKALVTLNDEVLPETTPSEYEIEYVEISDVKSGLGIVSQTSTTFGEAPSRARRRVKDGDVLVSTVRTYLRAIAPVRRPVANMIVSTGFAVVRAHGIASGFLGYTFQADAIIGEIISRSVGVSYPAINAIDLVSIKIAIPTVPEQTAIAAFLDRETAKIDALVEEQRRLIELLKEKRQAVISHAVTKGLDPTVPMKDSGVEWLGEVPAHWEVIQLKRLVLFQRGHDLPSQERGEGTIPIVASGGVIGTHDLAIARGPSIVTGRYGSIGTFRLVYGDYWPLNTALYSIHLGGDPQFVRHALENLSPLFHMNAVKSAVPGVDRNDVHRLFVAVPPFGEQRQIARHLDSILANLDDLATEAEAGIALLEERRSALISAAVTGKIDVRGLVTRETEAA